ncbi:MAG: response regulator transcription factor [Anaerolineales bacterium]|nr:response regulator transcription factor [Anaerolineales bacterium]MBX3038867.1 response regulator transcription factor [Anaerolineales bacterium]
MKSPDEITVLVADDHPLALEGVRSILEKTSDIKIVGEVQDGNEIKPMLAKLQPRILLLDLKMPNLDSVEIEKWVRENYPNTLTLVLTAHDKDSYLANMMEAGAVGYLDKKLQAAQLIASIRRAAWGNFIFDKEQIERAKRWREEVTAIWESLSKRERDVLQLLTEGKDNKSIAEILVISTNTVEKHLRNVYSKLTVSSRAEAILWWLEKGTDFRT